MEDAINAVLNVTDALISESAHLAMEISSFQMTSGATIQKSMVAKSSILKMEAFAINAYLGIPFHRMAQFVLTVVK